MPFTPYHLGPSACIGLAFRKWIDIPVFVLANVIIDIEVLVVNYLRIGWPYHRYLHTFLIGAAIGTIWALLAYPLRNFFKKIMQWLCIPYQTSLSKMLISGVLGIWLHAIIDAIYHYDVPIFWPSRIRPFWKLLSQPQVELVCLGFWAAALILYAIILKAKLRQSKTDT